jgi:hypothetical protein
MANKRAGYLLFVGTTAGLLLIFVVSWARIRPDTLVTGILGPRTRNLAAGELYGSTTMGQVFWAPHPNLYRIDLLITTYGRENTQEVIFHLRSDPQAETDLVRISIDASKLVDNAFHSFTFAPLSDSEGKTYYFFLESPNSLPGDAVSVRGQLRDIYPEGQAHLNGLPARGDLAFVTHYEPDRLQPLLDRLTENKPSIFGDRRYYVLLTLLYLSVLASFLLQVSEAATAGKEKQSDRGDDSSQEGWSH